MSENVKGTDAPKRGPGRPPRDPKFGAMTAAERSRRAYRRRQEELEEAAYVMRRLIRSLEAHRRYDETSDFPASQLETALKFIERYDFTINREYNRDQWKRFGEELIRKNQLLQNRRRKSA